MAGVQISRKIFLIKIDCLHLDFYFFYIKNSDLQIFQKDQLKYCFNLFARNVLWDTNLFVFYNGTEKVCSKLILNTPKINDKNQK